MGKTALDEILVRLRATQRELDQEFDRLLADSREQFRYSLQRGKVVFEQGMRLWHRQQRTGVWRYLRQAPVAYLLSAPFIYGMIVPLLLLDAALTLYQHVCFRVYRIPRVRRGAYFRLDRHRLAYLNGIEKLNCLYCGYANQLIEYAREVVARTERYWCPIKHAQRTVDPHRYTAHFFEYGDAQSYRHEFQRFRRSWSPEDAPKHDQS